MGALTRLAAVSALAAVLAPASAHATGGCTPRFRWETVTVGDQTVTYPVYTGMVC